MLSVSVLVAFVDEAFAVAMVSCSLKNQPELSGWSRDFRVDLTLNFYTVRSGPIPVSA